MMTHLSDYEKEVFKNVETKLELNKWYYVTPKDKPIRKDINEFISAIKKRIDIHGDCEFNGTYTKFKKIRTWEEELEYWKNSDSQRMKRLKK